VRTRGLTDLIGVRPQPGLTDLVDDVPSSSVIKGSGVDADATISVVACGSRSTDPAAFFRTGQFRRAMSRLKREADLVIVDAPPILAVSDTSAIAAQSDGIVMVVRNGTAIHQLEAARDRLAFIGVPVLGYVFNRADPRHSQYGYSNGYSYSHGESEPSTKVAARSHSRRKSNRATESV
jgi:Mrp family chromosome partitioning ATPase